MADIPDAEVADPEVGTGPTTEVHPWLRAAYGIAVIYQARGKNGVRRSH